MTVDVVRNGVSRSDSEPSDPAEDHVGERVLRQDEFADALNAGGYTNVLVLRRENGREVLTEGRQEVIRCLDEHGDAVESVSALARHLGRDKGAVSKDLARLAELDIVVYEGEGDGEAKRPVLKHDTVVVEPVVY